MGTTPRPGVLWVGEEPPEVRGAGPPSPGVLPMGERPPEVGGGHDPEAWVSLPVGERPPEVPGAHRVAALGDVLVNFSPAVNKGIESGKPSFTLGEIKRPGCQAGVLCVNSQA